MSDRGIPKTFRHMHGFRQPHFSFIGAANERFSRLARRDAGGTLPDRNHDAPRLPV
jgi:hypothetical protein